MVDESLRAPTAWMFLLLATGLGAAVGCGGNVAISPSAGTTSGSGGAASSGTVTGGTTSTATLTGAGGGGACPAAQPAAGSPCSVEGQLCPYRGSGCDGGGTMRCSGAAWATVPVSPPACVCPPVLPVHGSACDPCCPEPCPFNDGGCGPVALCSAAGTWNVEMPNCPAVACSVHANPQACAGLPWCRWLVPACGGDPPAFTEGCFDATDCTPGALCPSGQSCVAVDTNPCWDSNCAACAGSKAAICVGPG
jgi:hypothetical protein